MTKSVKASPAELVHALQVARGRRQAQARAFSLARVSARRDAGKGIRIVSASGRRFRSFAAAVQSKQRVYLLAVDRLGRVTVFNREDPRTRGLISRPVREPQKLNQMDFARLARLRPKRFASAVPTRPDSPAYPGRVKVLRGDLHGAAQAMQSGLARAIRSDVSQSQWGARVGLLLSDGRRIEFSTAVIPSVKYFKSVPTGAPGRRISRLKLTRGRSFGEAVTAALYAGSALALMYHGLIGQGSAARIRRLSANAGRRPAKFVDKAGSPWRGRGKKITAVTAAEWQWERKL